MAIGQQYLTNRLIGRAAAGATGRAKPPPVAVPSRHERSTVMSRSRSPGHRFRPAASSAPWASTLDVTVEETPDNIRLNLTGEGADVLLRRKGETLDALQVIVNTAFRRDARGDRHYVVDALGFRKGKDAELRQMAQLPDGQGARRPACRRRSGRSIRTRAASSTSPWPKTRR